MKPAPGVSHKEMALGDAPPRAIGLPPTFAAVLPEAQVHRGNLLAASHALGVRRHPEDVSLQLLDAVAVVTDDTSEGRLPDLSQLRRREDSRILIPKPAVGGNHSVTQE